MPYPPEHKEKTRLEILRSARTLFNQRGFSEVSIDEIMAGAGLTRGGFYAHFQTKDELYAEAVTLVLAEHPAENWDGVDLKIAGPEIARSIVNAYLSKHHFEDVAGSCPLIALPSDVARGGPPVKKAFQQVLEAMVGLFATSFAGRGERSEDSRQQALALAALCVGGMVLARGVSDPALAENIRAAALASAMGAWDEQPDQAAR